MRPRVLPVLVIFSSAEEHSGLRRQVAEPLSAEFVAQDACPDHSPALRGRPSRRDGPDAMQQVADERDGSDDNISFFMQDAHFHTALSGMLHLPHHAGEQRGAARYRFAVVLLIKEAHIEAPPVGDQGDEVGHDPAGEQFFGRADRRETASHYSSAAAGNSRSSPTDS